ncbi:MAG: hypothetical protein ACRC46_14620 [Thermoguttaceae bacterium]
MNGIKHRLAVGIIGHCDSTTLEATVASVRGLSDHIFFLDTDRDDAACVLAESLGVSVIRHEWQSSGAATRNALIDAVEGSGNFEWLLWVRGGEIFHRDYIHAFRFFCESELHVPQVFMMTAVSYHLAHGESLEEVVAGKIHRNSDRDEEIAEPRLIPLHRQLRYVGHVRETLICEDADAVINVGGAPGLFVSVAPYLDSEDRRNARVRRNIAIVCDARNAGEPIVDELLILHAETVYEMGDFNLARDCYRQVIAQSQKNNLKLEAYYRAADLFELTSQTPDETIAFLVSGLDLFPLDQQLLALLGMQLQRQKNTDFAIRALETAVQFGNVAFDVVHRRHITEQAIVALSLAHQLAGDNASAIEVVEKRLHTVCLRETLTDRLFDLYFIENRLHDALRIAETIWQGDELRVMRDVVTGACRGSIGVWEAAIKSLENAYVSGGSRHPMTLRWYSLALLAMRRFDDAIPVLDQWVATEPDNVGARAFRFAAETPETFAETMVQIQRSQMDFLGIDSITTKSPRLGFGAILDGLLTSGGNAASFGDEVVATKPHHALALAEFVESSACANTIADLECIAEGTAVADGPQAREIVTVHG